MPIKNVYVHLDTTSNSIHSKGVYLTDFAKAIPDKPQNILLLDPKAAVGEFESHTGLRMIRGEAEVMQFLSISRQPDSQVKWIDFKELHFLQQLTPLEIAELLYFSHVGRQLHSPFFYKLQNNFVYFANQEKQTKVYYRHVDNFYHVLAEKLKNNVYQLLNRRRFIFKPNIQVISMREEFLDDLKPVFQEGVLFAFSEIAMETNKITIPLFIVEDRLRKIESKQFNQADYVASIVYQIDQGSWSIEQADWELLPNLKQV